MRLLILALLCIPYSLVAQDNPAIDSLVLKGKSLASDDPEQSLKYSYQAYSKSIAAKYYWGKANAAGWIAEAYYYKGHLDSVDKYDHLALDLSREEEDWPAVKDNLITIGKSQKEKGNYREALKLFTEGRIILEQLKDTIELADLHLRIGGTYDNLDIVDTSMIHYDIAINYGRAINDKKLIGQSLHNMSIIHKKLGQFDQALETLQESRTLFESIDNKYGLLVNANMAGVIYKSMKRYDEALVEYERVKTLSTELDFKRGHMAYGINTGTIYNLLERYPKAEVAFRVGVSIADELDIPLSLSDAKSGLSSSLLGQGRINESEKEMKEALALAEEIESLDKQLIAHKVAKDIYQKKNSLDKTVYHLEAIQMLNDSVFHIEKAKQVDELQTKYETSKKDAEIKILNKEAELDETKQKALWGGIGLLSLLAGGIIYGQTQRRKRLQEKAQREQQVEIEKRQQAEQQLEFKKKELTAKVLQLASKNEFLQSLEEQVGLLKSSVDDSVSQASQKISRMIHNDTLDDQEWDQFGKEFSSIHQDFMDRLKLQFGDFTKNEFRLISLMKMNLSSKDIANTLRITDVGIKKARYRLRKKMNLESEVDIQNFLISY